MNAVRIINERPLLREVAQGSRWLEKDGFPFNELLADEAVRWLEYAQSKDQFDRFLPRLKDVHAKRDEAFAEIQAAYFVEVINGYWINEWEPIGAQQKRGEFSFLSPNGAVVFCEVKSPGWEADIVRVEGPKAQRLSDPKHINGGRRSFGNWRYVRGAVKKAYEKFPQNTLTLLIIVDDFIVQLSDDVRLTQIALYRPKAEGQHNGYLAEDGCFVGTQYENLGAIAALNVVCAGNIDYRFSLYHNPNARPAVRIPERTFPKYPQYFKSQL